MTQTLRNMIVAALQDGAVKPILSAAELSDDGVDHPELDLFLDGVSKISPFLRRLMRQSSDRLLRVLAASPEDGFQELLPTPRLQETMADAKIRLRQSKADLALAIALADLADLWSVQSVTHCLSHFADLCIQQALNAAWFEVGQSRGVTYEGEAWPTHPTGLVVIAMGKLGAMELNYSSDIDLVAIFDPDRMKIAEDSRLDAKAVSVKTIQFMVDILNQQTEHGYVFRTDLRLRPNPSATSVAVSIAAAETYYEVYGQNWERAAYIKARANAGDVELGQDYADLMRPFVWRRTLDFGAVADIHAIKNQIHAEKGVADLEVRGGNIKLGPGGIREIEFFAQTQQLLLGGRNEELRAPQTLNALSALSKFEHVDEDISDKLKEAYLFHRRLEHRLQMREDAQTQHIPADDDTLLGIAKAMGYETIEQLVAETESRLRIVHDAYADLFGAPEPGEKIPGSLVFTGVEDDPRTLETLQNIGFNQPEFVTNKIRKWHQGGLRATRSVRARELLTDLVPRILSQLGQLTDPDAAFASLDSFLVELPGGFQVFALFTANPEILDDVLLICQSSPEMARKMGQRPSLVEGLLEGVDVSPTEFPAVQAEDILEDRLDTVRRVVNEHRTRCSASIVLGRANPEEVSHALSDMADQSVADLINAVRDDLAVQGKPLQGQLGVVGFGRHGMRTLTTLSDLDLVFVYEADKDQEGGEQYFARLIRRIVSALSVPTAEGELYTIDMKLRPSGGAGPTAVSLTAFERYYRETAWVWEEMALTKARLVFSDAGFEQKLQSVIDQSLVRDRDAQSVQKEVVSMRHRLLQEKPAKSVFDVKHLKGGLTDIDFLVQGLSLIHAHEFGRFPLHPINALYNMKALHIVEEAEELARTYRLFEDLVQYTRGAFGNNPPMDMDEIRARRLRQLSPQWTEAPLVEQIEQRAKLVSNVFEKYMGPLEDGSSRD